MKIEYCEQNSPEWFAVRAGRVTSSVIDDVMRAKADAKTRNDLKLELVGEMLGGPSDEEGFVSKRMQQGKDKEPRGRTAYELANNVMLEKVGFVYHPTIERAGSSPDSLIGDDGVLELKCPMRKTHLDYRVKNCIPSQYVKQCIWHLACTGRKWCDFVSFSPELPDHLQLFVVRLEADREVIERFNEDVRQFLAECDDLKRLIELGRVEKVLA